MTTALQHPAVRAYLDELRALLAGSPDRDLVLDGVTRHIEDELAGTADDARVRAVLQELGDPATIAAESAPAPSAPVPFLDRSPGGGVTVLVLTFGGLVLPVLGWVVGLGMLWASKGWTLVDKLVGTLGAPIVAAVSVGITLLVGAITARPVTGGELVGPPAHLGLIVGLPLGAILVAVYLLARFRPRQ